MGDDSEWIKLPTDEKCVHKAWKSRVAGYEEAAKAFAQQTDERSPEFSRYLGLLKKFVIDSNAVAQEKALDAVLIYVENAAVAGKTAGEVCNGIIAKCLNSSRTKTKEKGKEILLLYIEIEKQDVVQEELLKGLTNKQPKIVAACVNSLRQALQEFGPKVMALKPIVKQLQRLLEDRDRSVRDEAKLLVVEIYRWIGAALQPQLSNLKPVQVTELEAEFQQLPPGKAQQTRFLRSQQDLKAKMEEAAMAAGGDDADGDEADGDDGQAEVDAFDLIDPVAILAKLPANFYEKIEATKWQERKEMLDLCLSLAESPKLEQADYFDLVKALRKVISKDKNVMLVTVAIKCVGCLAAGLRKKFSTYSASCVDVLLEKYKEKKATVIAALNDSIDAVYATTTLEAVSELCLAALDHKTPTVKTATAGFLVRCFSASTPATLPKKLLKLFAAQLTKTIQDMDPLVREASCNALGTAMKVVGEKPLMPFLAEVDSIKMTKIKECCENAVLMHKGKASKSAAPAKAAPVAKVAPKVVKKAEPAKAAAPAAAGRPASGPTKGAKKKAAPASKTKKPVEEALENILTDEAVEEKVGALLPADVVANLASSNWKQRLEAMERFSEVVSAMSDAEICTQAFVRTVVRKPGLKDTNFQVLKLKIDLLASLAARPGFTRRSAMFCLTELVDKIGDVKNGASVQAALSYIAEATTLEYVSEEVMQLAFSQKNPKNQSETLTWLAQAVRDFGLKVNVKAMIAGLKKGFAATNPAIRAASTTLVGVMYLYVGPQLRAFFDSEKPALLQQIDTLFEKMSAEKPTRPTRGLTSQTTDRGATDGGGGDDGGDEGGEEEEAGGSGGEGGGGGFNVADLVPRTDISERLTDALLNEMRDKNWKVRNEALQKLTAILNDAKFITPHIGALPDALVARLTDANKNLIMTTLTICQTLVAAMGPNIRTHTKTLSAGIIGCLGDSKPHVRASALATLKCLVEQGGLAALVESEELNEQLAKENPFLRAELLGFLSEKLPACRKLPAELHSCASPLYVCLEDRNADVRKRALDTLLPLMVHLGYDKMARQAGKLKQSSKDHILPLLDKTRAALPAKTAKPPRAPGPSSAPPPGAPDVGPPPATKDVTDGARPVKTAPSGGAAKGKGKGAAAAGKKAPATASSTKKDQQEASTQPPLRVSNAKEQRFKDERNLKLLKWNFALPRLEFVDQIRQQVEPTFSKSLVEQLFHADFKMHIKALDVLTKACDEDGIAATVANLDLILKWLTLRFFDTNTTVLLKVIEYVRVVFTALGDIDYHLHDLEATSFVPYLMLKVGDPKDNVRRDIRAIIKLLCRLYPASKMFVYVIDGLKSKNSKSRTECLEELGCLIESYGIAVAQPSPQQALKLIAQQIGSRDNGIRSAALNTVVTAHTILGDNLYKYIGALNDKDQSMLDERIKRSAKSRPPPPAAAAPPGGDEKTRASKPAAAGKNGSESARGGRASVGKAKAAVAPPAAALDLLGLPDDAWDPTVKPPSLIELDLTDMLDYSVKLPASRSRQPTRRLKLVGGSTRDAKSAIDLVISQVASQDIATSIEALTQVDEVLGDGAQTALFAQHVDQFLAMASLQLRMTSSRHMAALAAGADPGTDGTGAGSAHVIKLYRCLLGSLLAVFQKRELVQSPSRDVLHDLMLNLITVLLDARLNDLDDGPQLVRSINLFLVKVVEKANHTHTISALIRLLHESVASESCSTTFVEVIMKCLWRMVRMLPTIIDELNIDVVLCDLHLFLKAYPSHTWRHRASDVPLRTVKTIIHSLAKLKGNKIMSHLTLIESPQSSEVENYMQKVLRSGDTQAATVAAGNAKNDQLNGGDGAHKEAAAVRASKRLSRSTHDLLAEIFEKIGSKENTREGLNDLYDFKIRYPETDLDPFLRKSSTIFQNYIQRGLKDIEAERAAAAASSGPSSGSSASSVKTFASEPSVSAPPHGPAHPTYAAGDDENLTFYRQRLKELRARCGLDGAPNAPASATAAPGGGAGGGGAGGMARVSSAPTPFSATTKHDDDDDNVKVKVESTAVDGKVAPPSAASNAATVEDLRRRLERIKNSAAAAAKH